MLGTNMPRIVSLSSFNNIIEYGLGFGYGKSCISFAILLRSAVKMVPYLSVSFSLAYGTFALVACLDAASFIP
jgi:hypothetical protein